MGRCGRRSRPRAGAPLLLRARARAPEAVLLACPAVGPWDPLEGHTDTAELEELGSAALAMRQAGAALIGGGNVTHVQTRAVRDAILAGFPAIPSIRAGS